MKKLFGIILLVASLVGCDSGGGGGSDSPTSPSATVDVTGTYSGNWSSSVVSQSGSLVATLTQSGSTVSGTIGIENSSCFSSGNILNGTVSGSTISWSGSGIGNFSGTVSGNTITGSYNVTQSGDCYGDHGTFSVTK